MELKELFTILAWILLCLKTAYADFEDIACDDCEPFTIAFDYADSVTTGFSYPILCTDVCVFAATPLGVAEYYFVTYRYNKHVADGTEAFLPDGDSGGDLPPPSACLVESTQCDNAKCTEDIDKPTIISVPADITVNTDPGLATGMVTWDENADVAVMDNVPCIVTLTTDLPQGPFGIGTVTVTYTATDARGNQDMEAFTVTVNDIEGCVIVVGSFGDIMRNTEPGKPDTEIDLSLFQPTATDNSGRGCTLSYTSSPVPNSPGNRFGIGTTVITYTATDDFGNAGTPITFNIIITDIEGCVIDVGSFGDIMRNTDPGKPDTEIDLSLFQPTATDNSGRGCTLSYTSLPVPNSPGNRFGIGTTVITYTATDDFGNAGTPITFNIIITDIEGCVIDVGSFGDIMRNTDPGKPDTEIDLSLFQPTASDNSGRGCTLSYTSLPVPNSPGNRFGIGTTVITYTATDDFGNAGTPITFNIFITDIEGCVIVVGSFGDIMRNTEPGKPDTEIDLSLFQPTATDNSGRGCTLSYTSLPVPNSPGNRFGIGTTVITYTATDDFGNAGTSITFNIIITDMEVCKFSMVPDMSVNTDDGEDFAEVEWDDPEVTDNSELACTVTQTHNSPFNFPIGDTLVTYEAEDPYGNTNSFWFTVTVTDNELCTFSNVPAPGPFQTDTGIATGSATWTAPGTSDNSGDPPTLTSSHNPGDNFPIGVTVVTYTCTDSSNNVGEVDFPVTIEDDEPPVISGKPPNELTKNVPFGTGSGVVTWPDLTATDNSGVVTLTSDLYPPVTLNAGDDPVTVTYTAVDPSGNTAIYTFTVQVLEAADVEEPVITNIPGDITLPTDLGQPDRENVVWAEPNASDNSGMVTLTSTHVSNANTFPIGTTTVTYTASDDDKNMATASFFVTITDIEAPVISGNPGNLNVNNDPGLATAVVSWTVTAIDNSGNFDLTSNFNSGHAFPIGSTTVTYTAIDPSGNEDDISFTVTVTDNEPPVISNVAGNICQNNDLTEPSAAVTWAPLFVTENSGVFTLTCTHESGDTFPIGDTVVSCTATDPAGSMDIQTFMVTVKDVEPPVISDVPSNIIRYVIDVTATVSVSWTLPTIEDNSGTVTVTASYTPPSVFGIGTFVVSYTAEDPSGNEAVASFVVIVEESPDLELPVIIGVPGNINRNTDFRLPTAVVNWSVTATDNSGPVTLTANYDSGYAFPIGVVVVSFTAIDIYGNVAIASFVLTVIDVELPVIDGTPNDIVRILERNSDTAFVTWTNPNATDNSGVVDLRQMISHPRIGKRQVASSVETEGFFRVGVSTVTYIATDPSNNVATSSFTITITDIQGPTILNPPEDIVTETDPGLPTAQVTWRRPTVVDNSLFYRMTSSHNPGTHYPIGTTVVTYTAVDIHNNTNMVSFTVTVIDAEDPIITGVPTTVAQPTQSFGQQSAVVIWTPPSATDNSGVVTLTSSHSPGQVFPLGETIVTYTAIDPSNNTDMASFTVLVTEIDQESPVISGLLPNITRNTDPGQATAVVTWPSPAASDNSGDVTLTSDHDSGDKFEIGVTIVTYTATDPSENEAKVAFTITVIDMEPPEFDDIADITQDTDPNQPWAVVRWTVRASDNSGLVTVTSSHNPSDRFPIGSTTVTYTARDPSSNEFTVSFVITIVDNEDPVISASPDIFRRIDGNRTKVTWTPPKATDNSGQVTLTSSHNSGSIFKLGETKVTYTAVDPADNVATRSITVTITDEDINIPIIVGIILGAIFALLFIIALPAVAWYIWFRQTNPTLGNPDPPRTLYHYPHSTIRRSPGFDNRVPELFTTNSGYEAPLRNPLGQADVDPAASYRRVWQKRPMIPVR